MLLVKWHSYRVTSLIGEVFLSYVTAENEKKINQLKNSNHVKTYICSPVYHGKISINFRFFVTIGSLVLFLQ